jgi:hypothetical protein
MRPPFSPPPTSASLVRNVAQGMRLMLDLPENHALSIVISRATLERWCEHLYASLLLREQEERHHRDA